MRVPFWSCLLALGLTGCLPQASLQPFVPPGTGIETPGIVGAWADSSAAYRFDLEREDGRPRYVMSSPGPGTDSTRFVFRFTRAGGRLFADVEVDVRSLPGGPPDPWLWTMHTAFRVDLEGDSLRLAYLDDGWVEQALKDRRLKVRHETRRGELLLTEDTPGLLRMLARIANESAAFDTTARFARRRPE